MAERRMFAKTIIDSDAFLDMPQSTQLLYFHLSMRADDDGFTNKPKSIMTIVGCKEDDLKILVAKKFIIPFDSGIVVIKHWNIHNYIARDRYTETKYKEEKATLGIDENKAYTTCIQPVYTCETQVRLGKVSIDKDSIVEKPSPAPKVAKPPFIAPTLAELKEYAKGKGYTVDCERFLDYYSTNSWKDKNNKPVKNWKLKMVSWNTPRESVPPPAPIPVCPECGELMYDVYCRNGQCPSVMRLFDDPERDKMIAKMGGKT